MNARAWAGVVLGFGLVGCASGGLRYAPQDVVARTADTISISYVMAGEKQAYQLAAEHCAGRAAVPAGSAPVGPYRTTTTWRCE